MKRNRLEAQPRERMTWQRSRSGHVNSERGDLSEEDQKGNDCSLEQGFRILSSYRTNAGDELRIIKELDRSVPPLLFPEEY